jgi:hypothetical protein
VDSAGDAYVTGTAYTLHLPLTSGAYQPQNNETQNGGANYYGGNAFMTEIGPDGSGLVYSTYLGGTGPDVGTGIAVDPSDNVYVVGYTESCAGTGTLAFPTTTGAFETTGAACAAGNTGSTNAFISKIGTASTYQLIATSTTVSASPVSQNQGSAVTFTAKVKPASGSGVAAGTVGFSVDAGPDVYVVLDSTGQAKYSTTSLLPGKHTIVASFRGDVDYSSSQGSTAEKTIGPPALIGVVSGSAQSTVYGSAFAKPLVVVVQDEEGNPVAGAKVDFTGTGLKFTGDPATTAANGEASVTATAIAAGALTATASVTGAAKTAKFTLNAGKALLTVQANDATVAYGKPLPHFTFTASGYLNGDKPGVLKGVPAEKTTAKAGSPLGTYLITAAQGTLTAANYRFQFVNGVLTIIYAGVTAAPTFAPAAGTYSSAQSVTIKDKTPGAVIYYTTDGSTPNASSPIYSKPIKVSAAHETIKAIALATGYQPSAVSSAAYTIQ